MALALRMREERQITRVLTIPRECYANRLSGELVAAYISGIASPSAADTVVVEDEYGGVSLMPAADFFARFEESSICPTVGR